jgi:hypothetical protein
MMVRLLLPTLVHIPFRLEVAESTLTRRQSCPPVDGRGTFTGQIEDQVSAHEIGKEWWASGESNPDKPLHQCQRGFGTDEGGCPTVRLLTRQVHSTHKRFSGLAI